MNGAHVDYNTSLHQYLVNVFATPECELAFQTTFFRSADRFQEYIDHLEYDHHIRYFGINYEAFYRQNGLWTRHSCSDSRRR